MRLNVPLRRPWGLLIERVNMVVLRMLLVLLRRQLPLHACTKLEADRGFPNADSNGNICAHKLGSDDLGALVVARAVGNAIPEHHAYGHPLAYACTDVGVR